MVVSLITVYKSGQTVRLEIEAVVEYEFQVHGVGFQVVRIVEPINHKLTPVQVAKDGLCCYPIGDDFFDIDLDLAEFLEKASEFTEDGFLAQVESWEKLAADYPLELPGFD